MILQPNARRNLFDILRPDHGYQLDFAVGTSYSLDLNALLTIPLSFTLFGSSVSDEPQRADPVVLFDSLQRYASRIALFCQAGGIYLPGQYRPLLGYLEKSVHQVVPKTENRVFHPKIWVLRYLPAGVVEAAPRYRLVCLSRNLTFDRSWDTALVLDGVPDSHTHAENRPLADFLTALPQLAIHSVDDEQRVLISRMAEELQGIGFDPPPGFRDVTFVPLGLDSSGPTPLQMNFDRVCVVSPFLNGLTLGRVTRAGSRHVLISRLEALQELPSKALAGFEQVYALSDAATAEPDDTLPAVSDGDARPREEDRDQLSGLHAKLFIGEVGSTVYVWTGSANATPAAFSGNVEFMVRLQGDRATHGVDAFLGYGPGQDGMANLLEPFTPGVVPPKDETQKTLEKLIDLAQRALVDGRFQGRVAQDPNQNQETFSIELQADRTVPWSSAVDIRCWPITLAQGNAQILNRAGSALPVRFPSLSFEALTTFFAFHLTARQEDRTAGHTLVLNIPLSGLPEGRENRLLQAILKDRSQLMRLLWLLLADMDHEDIFGSGLGGAFQDGIWGARGGEMPLFEVMVRALDRDPARLDTVARVVDKLQESPESRALLPEQFDEIWQPIWAMRQALRAESNHGTN